MASEELRTKQLPPLEWKTELADGTVKLQALTEGESGTEEVGMFTAELHEEFDYIRRVFVSKDHRRSGMGTQLIAKMNAFLRSEGKYGLIKEDMDADSAGAEGIYEDNGWKRVPDRLVWFFYVPDTVPAPSEEKMQDMFGSIMQK